MSNEQTQATDDPSDDRYWRNVLPSEILQPDDMMRTMAGLWLRTTVPGRLAREGGGGTYRRRIEPQPQAINPDDPSGPGWRDVSSGEILHVDDMVKRDNGWGRTRAAGTPAGYQRYRRRIEPQQPSDSETETIEDLRRRLAEAEALVAEADRGGEQVNAELQQLREQVRDLTRERDRYRNQLEGAIEHSSASAARQQVLERLQEWLTPVLELVAENPEDCAPLAVSILGYLPGIAARLTEE